MYFLQRSITYTNILQFRNILFAKNSYKNSDSSTSLQNCMRVARIFISSNKTFRVTHLLKYFIYLLKKHNRIHLYEMLQIIIMVKNLMHFRSSLINFRRFPKRNGIWVSFKKPYVFNFLKYKICIFNKK